MSEHPIIQISTALRGEGQVVVRVSSEDDVMTADTLLSALQGAITGKMNTLAQMMKESPNGIELIKQELGGVPIANYPPPLPPAPMAPTVQAVASTPCNQGTRGPHAMACKHCAGPIGERKQLGNFTGHQCQVPGSQCKPTWCN